MMIAAKHSTTAGSRFRVFIQTIPKSFLLGGLAGVLALIVYLLTIAPDLTWANYSSDSGELITASVTLGVAHPPGYPTYILLGKLFSTIPYGSVAFRFNLFSSVAMAIAIAFSTSAVFEFLPKQKSTWAAALAAGLSLAFSSLVWSQAIVAEVYALNLAILSIFLWSLLNERSSWLTGIMLGLAITTHLTSLLMLPLSLALTPRNKKKQLVIGLAIGLLPLLLVPLFAQLGSPVIWGEPTTVAGWWWLISAQLYRANIHLPHADSSFITYLSFWSRTILSQFAWIGWLFIIVGVMTHKVQDHRSRWLFASAGVFAVFSIIYSPNDAILLLLPALLLLLPFLALGLTRLYYWSLLLPFLLLAINFQAQNLGREPQVRPIVDRTLATLPSNAIILTPGDYSIFTLWYFQHVEGRRTDLILADENLLAFDWYRQRLSARYPDLTGLLEDNVVQFRVQNLTKRPVCNVTLQVPANTTCQKPENINLNDNGINEQNPS